MTQIREKIKEEFKKSATSAQYFLKKYTFIQHPKRGRISFDLYGYQSDCINKFKEHRYNIVLKGRQIGISTVVAGYALWLMLFHNDKKVLVIATKQETAKNLVNKVQFMYDGLPSWMKFSKDDVTKNKLSLGFPNGSEIKAVSSSPDAGRSEALSLLIIDECAFIDDAVDIWASAQATLSTGGDAILVSTPNGQGNFFHKMWIEAESGQNGFNTILLDWKVHPERDQEWRDEQTRKLGEILSAQEHDASFIFSGNTVIPPEIIEFYKSSFMQDPIKKTGLVDDNLWVWEPPAPGKSYIVAADIARGDGEDFSTLQVIDIESSSQVAEYKGKQGTKEFGNFMVSVATEYNGALLIPDNSSIGWNAIQQAIDLGYRNLFYMSKDLQYVDVEQQITDFMREDKKLVPGFTISSRTRPLLIARLKEYMMENSFTIRSSRLLAELETFIWQNGRAEALRMYNDDLVLALCMGLWVRDTALRLRQQGIELSKLALDKTSYMAHGIPNSIYAGGQQTQNPYEMDIAGTKENLLWLL
jgi:hypothetical protein